MDVKEEIKVKKTNLLKLLLKHLCTEEEGEGDKLEKWLMIHSHLNPDPDSDEEVQDAEGAASAKTVVTDAALTNPASTNAVKVEPVSASLDNSDSSSSKKDAVKLRRNAGKKDASVENAVRKQDV